MVKSGLIIGGTMLVLAGITGALNFLICALCLAPFAGLGAGYWAGLFDRPSASNLSVRSGAIAGTISGAGLLLGLMIGGVIGALLTGPEQAAQIGSDLFRSLGVPFPADSIDPLTYYSSAFLTWCCCGALNIALLAGLGALGGLLWWQMTGKNQSGAGALPPSMPA